MKTKFFAINFICAAAFLVAANVQADLIAPKWVGQGNEFVKLDSYSVFYDGTSLAAIDGNLQRNPGADSGKGYASRVGWSYSITAPKDFRHF